MDRATPEVEFSSVGLIPSWLPSLLVESRVDKVLMWVMAHPPGDNRGTVHGVVLVDDVVTDELQKGNGLRAVEWNGGEEQVSRPKLCDGFGSFEHASYSRRRWHRINRRFCRRAGSGFAVGELCGRLWVSRWTMVGLGNAGQWHVQERVKQDK